MYNEQMIIEMLDKVINNLINEEVLESYLYEYDRVDKDSSYTVKKFSQIYLTKSEIIKACYTYNEEKLLPKIYIERTPIKNKDMKLKYTYKLDSSSNETLIDLEALNNFDFPKFTLEKSKEDYRSFLIKFYELHLNN